MKFRLLIILCVFVLVSCSPRMSTTRMDPECSASGEVYRLTLEETTRGYSYSFRVYLPPCYDENAPLGYPVIFMIPGRGGGPGDWFEVGVHEIAERLIAEEETPPFLIVTGENTNTDTNADDIYGDLIPHIHKTYNTSQARNHQAVAGGSLGGIAAYRLILMHPDEFASAGMFGSGVVNGEDERVLEWLEAVEPGQSPRFFLNVGEDDPLMLAQAEVMVEYLEGAQVDYVLIVGDGGHTYDYWASNMEAYFIWAAEDW